MTHSSSDTSTRQFRMAPMDALNLVLTVVVGVIPLPIVAPAILAAAFGQPGTPVLFIGALTGSIALLIVALLAGIALYARPSRFVLSAEGLRVVWPVRERMIPLRDIAGVELLDRAQFRSRFGMGMRIGAGGFLGGFGWLKTERQTFDFYISRIDRYALVQVRTGHPLLITPEALDEFVRELQGRLAGS
jgi:hypothetical protein